MKSIWTNKKTWIPAIILVVLILGSFFSPLLSLPNPNTTDLSKRLLPLFTDGHFFGTDLLGRDVLSRLLHGMRLSIIVALAAAFTAGIIGIVIGLVAGYFRSYADSILMRFIDLLMAFPYMILALAIVAIMGPGLINALLAIAIVNIPFFSRTTRGLTIGLTDMPFVESARLGGQSHIRILFCEILPNALPTLLITLTTTFAWMLLETAGLSFLGLGAQPPTADLGSMLAEGKKLMLVAPHVALAPGFLILLIALCTNVLGDQLRDRIENQSTKKLKANLETNKSNSSPNIHPKPDALFSVQNLSIGLDSNPSIDLVKKLNFMLQEKECLGIVGESGSGKSISTLAIGGLLPKALSVNSGTFLWKGKDLKESDRLKLLGTEIAYIFQDPQTSLNPLMKIGEQIVEAIHSENPISKQKKKEWAIDWIGKVELPDPVNKFHSYPHELSGGQRQRVGIAMALINKPKLIIADEPTTALDVTVQRQIISLLKKLIKDEATSLILISHDLAVISDVCHRIIVMHDGELIEEGKSEIVLQSPKHEYTKHLIKCIPSLSKPEVRLPDTVYKG